MAKSKKLDGARISAALATLPGQKLTSNAHRRKSAYTVKTPEQQAASQANFRAAMADLNAPRRKRDKGIQLKEPGGIMGVLGKVMGAPGVKQVLHGLRQPFSYIASHTADMGDEILQGDLLGLASASAKSLTAMPVAAIKTLGDAVGVENKTLDKAMEMTYENKQYAKDFEKQTGAGAYGQRLIDHFDPNRDSWINTSASGKWLKRGAGLIGDVALDPLTYLTPGAAETAGTAESLAGRIAEQVPRMESEAMAEAAMKGLDDVAQQAAGKAARTYGEGLTHQVGTLGKHTMTEADFARVFPEAEHAPGLSWQLPGTGRIGRKVQKAFGVENPSEIKFNLIGKNTTNKFMRVGGKPIRMLGDAKILTKLTDRTVGEYGAEARKLMQRGDSAGYYTGLGVRKASQNMRAAAASGLRVPVEDGAFNAYAHLNVGVGEHAIGPTLGEILTKEVLPKLNNGRLDVDIIREIESFNAASGAVLSPEAEAVKTFFDHVHNALTKNGAKMGHRDNYVTRLLTKDAMMRVHAGNPLPGVLADPKASFMNRAVTPLDLGLPETATAADVRAHLIKYFSDTGDGSDIFEMDLNKLLGNYARAVDQTHGRMALANTLQAWGLAVTDEGFNRASAVASGGNLGGALRIISDSMQGGTAEARQSGLRVAREYFVANDPQVQAAVRKLQALGELRGRPLSVRDIMIRVGVKYERAKTLRDLVREAQVTDAEIVGKSAVEDIASKGGTVNPETGEILYKSREEALRANPPRTSETTAPQSRQPTKKGDVVDAEGNPLTPYSKEAQRAEARRLANDSTIDDATKAQWKIDRETEPVVAPEESFGATNNYSPPQDHILVRKVAAAKRAWAEGVRDGSIVTEGNPSWKTARDTNPEVLAARQEWKLANEADAAASTGVPKLTKLEEMRVAIQKKMQKKLFSKRDSSYLPHDIQLQDDMLALKRQWDLDNPGATNDQWNTYMSSSPEARKIIAGWAQREIFYGPADLAPMRQEFLDLKETLAVKFGAMSEVPGFGKAGNEVYAAVKAAGGSKAESNIILDSLVERGIVEPSALGEKLPDGTIVPMKARRETTKSTLKESDELNATVAGDAPKAHRSGTQPMFMRGDAQGIDALGNDTVGFDFTGEGAGSKVARRMEGGGGGAVHSRGASNETLARRTTHGLEAGLNRPLESVVPTPGRNVPSLQFADDTAKTSTVHLGPPDEAVTVTVREAAQKESTSLSKKLTTARAKLRRIMGTQAEKKIDIAARVRVTADGMRFEETLTGTMKELDDQLSRFFRDIEDQAPLGSDGIPMFDPEGYINISDPEIYRVFQTDTIKSKVAYAWYEDARRDLYGQMEKIFGEQVRTSTDNVRFLETRLADAKRNLWSADRPEIAPVPRGLGRAELGGGATDFNPTARKTVLNDRVMNGSDLSKISANHAKLVEDVKNPEFLDQLARENYLAAGDTYGGTQAKELNAEQMVASSKKQLVRHTNRHLDDLVERHFNVATDSKRYINAETGEVISSGLRHDAETFIYKAVGGDGEMTLEQAVAHLRETEPERFAATVNYIRNAEMKSARQNLAGEVDWYRHNTSFDVIHDAGLDIVDGKVAGGDYTPPDAENAAADVVYNTQLPAEVRIAEIDRRIESYNPESDSGKLNIRMLEDQKIKIMDEPVDAHNSYLPGYKKNPWPMTAEGKIDLESPKMYKAMLESAGETALQRARVHEIADVVDNAAALNTVRTLDSMSSTGQTFIEAIEAMPKPRGMSKMVYMRDNAIKSLKDSITREFDKATYGYDGTVDDLFRVMETQTWKDAHPSLITLAKNYQRQLHELLGAATDERIATVVYKHALEGPGQATVPSLTRGTLDNPSFMDRAGQAILAKDAKGLSQISKEAAEAHPNLNMVRDHVKPVDVQPGRAVPRAHEVATNPDANAALLAEQQRVGGLIDRVDTARKNLTDAKESLTEIKKSGDEAAILQAKRLVSSRQTHLTGVERELRTARQEVGIASRGLDPYRGVGNPKLRAGIQRDAKVALVEAESVLDDADNALAAHRATFKGEMKDASPEFRAEANRLQRDQTAARQHVNTIKETLAPQGAALGEDALSAKAGVYRTNLEDLYSQRNGLYKDGVLKRTKGTAAKNRELTGRITRLERMLDEEIAASKASVGESVASGEAAPGFGARTYETVAANPDTPTVSGPETIVQDRPRLEPITDAARMLRTGSDMVEARGPVEGGLAPMKPDAPNTRPGQSVDQVDLVKHDNTWIPRSQRDELVDAADIARGEQGTGAVIGKPAHGWKTGERVNGTVTAANQARVLEISTGSTSKLGRDLSAFNLKTADGTSVENVYQAAKRGPNGELLGKGKNPNHFILDGVRHEGGDNQAVYDLIYRKALREYVKANPGAIDELSGYNAFSDQFIKNNAHPNAASQAKSVADAMAKRQARVIAAADAAKDVTGDLPPVSSIDTGPRTAAGRTESLAMKYEFNAQNRNPNITAGNTFDAMADGTRTSTTRTDAGSMGAIDRARPGDMIQIDGNGSQSMQLPVEARFKFKYDGIKVKTMNMDTGKIVNESFDEFIGPWSAREGWTEARGRKFFEDWRNSPKAEVKFVGNEPVRIVEGRIVHTLPPDNLSAGGAAAKSMDEIRSSPEAWKQHWDDVRAGNAKLSDKVETQVDITNRLLPEDGSIPPRQTKEQIQSGFNTSFKDNDFGATMDDVQGSIKPCEGA